MKVYLLQVEESDAYGDCFWYETVHVTVDKQRADEWKRYTGQAVEDMELEDAEFLVEIKGSLMA